MSASRWSDGSFASAARNSSNSTRPVCSGCDFSVSAYRPSASSTSRRRLRYSERNRLRRMVNSHAGMLVPGSKESMWESARSSVSCTRSSARSILPHNEMANARRLGTVESTWSRIAGSSFIATSLWLSALIAQAADQVGDMLWHALIDDIVVHRPQLLADLGLNLTAQPCLRFRGGYWRAH